jgi:hypothetical protein
LKRELVLAFEKGVLAFEKGVLAFEKAVLAFEKGVVPTDRHINKLTHPFIRTDKCSQADHSRVSKQLSHLSYSPNILISILRGETQVLVETSSHVIAVQCVCRYAMTT